MNAVLKNKSVGFLKKNQTDNKKSVGERIMENIPDDRYKGLAKILEPHEIPKRNRQ
jgi:hypothetical protein